MSLLYHLLYVAIGYWDMYGYYIIGISLFIDYQLLVYYWLLIMIINYDY